MSPGKPSRAPRPDSRFKPALRFGWESVARFEGRTFDEVEPRLEREWDSHRGRSELAWMEVRPVVRAAWDRAAGRIRARGRDLGDI